MKNPRTLARVSAFALGGLLLTGVAGTAMAAEIQNDDVDVKVTISPLVAPGSLSMSVADTSTTLTENGSTALVRQFVGTLPTVTVTDTRDAADIPADAAWSVIGTSSDFIGSAGQPTIGADHLGWTPRLIDGGDSGLVTEGEKVDTVLDPAGPDSVGLVDTELLALAINSGDVRPEGSWTTTADLTLKTEPTVAAGNYTSVLTLSLFE